MQIVVVVSPVHALVRGRQRRQVGRQVRLDLVGGPAGEGHHQVAAVVAAGAAGVAGVRGRQVVEVVGEAVVVVVVVGLVAIGGRGAALGFWKQRERERAERREGEK